MATPVPLHTSFALPQLPLFLKSTLATDTLITSNLSWCFESGLVQPRKCTSKIKSFSGLVRAVSQKKLNTEFGNNLKILSFLRSNFKILSFIRSNLMTLCLYNVKILSFIRRNFMLLFGKMREKRNYYIIGRSFPHISVPCWKLSVKSVNTEWILSIFTKFRYYGKNPVIRSR